MNNRKARTGLLKVRKHASESHEPHEPPEKKLMKDRTRAHQSPSDWKKKKKDGRRSRKKAQRVNR